MSSSTDQNPTADDLRLITNMTHDNNSNKNSIHVLDDEDSDKIPSSSSCSSSSTRQKRRVSLKRRRRPRVLLAAGRRNGCRDVAAEAIALPLGMSFAAVLAEVMERNEVAQEGISIDRLSVMCTSAVRESLSNVFGNMFDCFSRNFEKSFESTLRTLKLINESSRKGGFYSSRNNFRKPSLVVTSHRCLNSRGSTAGSSSPKPAEMEMPNSQRCEDNSDEEVQDHVMAGSTNLELALHGETSQLACIAQSRLGSSTDQTMLSTFEKSVVEQTRSNDLKQVELGLTMRKMKLKEAELALSMDSNHLERSKLNIGISKASFKVEKFKNEVEDTRQAQLLRQCMDFLLAGMFLMAAFLAYGAYVFSYQRITEATESCRHIVEESKSWWIPKKVSSLSLGFQNLKCHLLVASQMVFASIIFFIVLYLFLQRSMTSTQTMPITFIVLLLGVVCGFAGKLCVDSLGGSGNLWLFYWETLCLLHLFANVCTSALYCILYGPFTVSQEKKIHTILPYWVRRVLFYIVLVLLPLSSALMPFASPSEWKDHFGQLVRNSVSAVD